MEKLKKITVDLLRSRVACPDQVKLFRWYVLIIIIIAAGIAWHFCYSQVYTDFWNNQLIRVIYQMKGYHPQVAFHEQIS